MTVFDFAFFFDNVPGARTLNGMIRNALTVEPADDFDGL